MKTRWRVAVLRTADLLNEVELAEKIDHLLDYHNFVLEQRFGKEPASLDKVFGRGPGTGCLLRGSGGRCQWATLSLARCRQGCIMFEGAQGSLLDIDHGTISLCHLFQYHRGRCVYRRGCRPRCHRLLCSESLKPT